MKIRDGEWERTTIGAMGLCCFIGLLGSLYFDNAPLSAFFGYMTATILSAMEPEQ